MDLRAGFQLEQPDVHLPWSVSETALRRLLGPHGLREVTRGYFTISGVSLGGLHHELGFHFLPRGGDHLHVLEFFRRSYPDQAASYREFQDHFERAFGLPTRSTPGTEGYPRHEWDAPGARVIHFVQDRFRLEEHMRIKRGRP